MPKSRHKKRKQKKKTGSLLLNVSKRLAEIDELIEDEDYFEAMSELEELATQAPHRADVFKSMLEVAMEVEDEVAMLDAATRLIELQPFVPEHHFYLFASYLGNMFPALALQTARHFLGKWPDSNLAVDVRKGSDDIEVHLRTEAEQLHIDRDDWLERLVQHEQVQLAMERGRYQEAIQLAKDLIDALPQFVPAYNNRSLAYWAEDDQGSAIADARQALELDPGDVHALSNLTRFLCLTNNMAEAREVAERLKKAGSKTDDAWFKKVEALSYLCDDAAVLQIARQADKAGTLFGEYASPFLLHLAGVAAARTGDEKNAKRYWEQALENDPDFYTAEEQLDDLERPPGQRNGAWPFELTGWMPLRRIEELEEAVLLKSNQESKGATSRFLKDHPEVAALVPVLFERGDPAGREFAIRLAQFSQNPGVHEELRKFALSKNGRDDVRREATNLLVELGVFQRGQAVRMWWGGEQRELMMSNYRIDFQPYEKLPTKAQEFGKTGFESLMMGDLDRAEEFYLKALAIAPGSVSMLFNMAMATLNRGNVKEAREELEKLAAKHPKYAFAPLELAMIALANDRKEQARRLLDSLSAFDRFHVQEFAAFCRTNALYCIVAESSQEGARRWIDMWEELSPDDPKLDLIRPLLYDTLFSSSEAKRVLEPYRETGA